MSGEFWFLAKMTKVTFCEILIYIQFLVSHNYGSR